jgi:hypothetical protein
VIAKMIDEVSTPTKNIVFILGKPCLMTINDIIGIGKAKSVQETNAALTFPKAFLLRMTDRAENRPDRTPYQNHIVPFIVSKYACFML